MTVNELLAEIEHQEPGGAPLVEMASSTSGDNPDTAEPGRHRGH